MATKALGVSSAPDRVPERAGVSEGMVAAGEGDRERNQVLQQGTSATGGGRHRVAEHPRAGAGAGPGGQRVVERFKVTFTRPGSAKMQDLQVGLLVEGVTLRATAAPFGTR